MYEVDNVHFMIDAGLAETCNCRTQSLSDKLCGDWHDYVGWTYTGGKDGVASLEDKEALAISRMIKWQGGFNWSKSVLYGLGRIELYKATHGLPIGDPEFVGELCDPDLIERLQEWVVESVGEGLVRWVKR